MALVVPALIIIVVGVPLIENATEPDIRSAAEAAAFVENLRAILLYADVSGSCLVSKKDPYVAMLIFLYAQKVRETREQGRKLKT